MEESKLKRIVAASTFTAVLLIIILLSTMIYQICSINNENRKIKELEKDIATYEQMIEDKKDGIEIRSMRWWIERRARELGYYYKGDVNYGGESTEN